MKHSKWQVKTKSFKQLLGLYEYGTYFYVTDSLDKTTIPYNVILKQHNITTITWWLMV